MDTKNTITINHTEKTEILIEKGLLDKLDKILEPYEYTSFIVLCDNTVEKLFAEKVKSVLQNLKKPIHLISIDEGENSKSFESLQYVLGEMLSRKMDIKSVLIALGGGVVGDLGTVVAGLYYRGINCIQVPTTLLAMVDSAIGGKGAVNIGTHKNSIGIIRQPTLIVIDPNVLKTLPNDQFISGMGEVAKYAISMDKDLFDKLEHADSLDPTLQEIIQRCVDLKTSIMIQDPLDTKNVRSLVNFGHTLGHAIELQLKIPHGKAVSIGVVFELILSTKLCGLSLDELKRCIALLKKYSLPTSFKKIDPHLLLEQMKKDKKSVDNTIYFTLITSIGKYISRQIVSDELILETLQEVME